MAWAEAIHHEYLVSSKEAQAARREAIARRPVSVPPKRGATPQPAGPVKAARSSAAQQQWERERQRMLEALTAERERRAAVEAEYAKRVEAVETERARDRSGRELCGVVLAGIVGVRDGGRERARQLARDRGGPRPPSKSRNAHPNNTQLLWQGTRSIPATPHSFPATGAAAATGATAVEDEWGQAVENEWGQAAAAPPAVENEWGR